MAIPHPVTQIMLWVGLAMVVQSLQSLFLPALALTLGFIAFKVHPLRMMTLLRRTRWILISLLVIYAFMTPGVALWSLSYIPNPTQEGLLDGLMQLSRLVCMLAALSILLTLLSQAQLVSGLYVLSYPLRYIGMSRERVAVRLALTLEYAERAMQVTAKDWRSGIEHALAANSENVTILELPIQKLSRIDVLFMLLICAVVIGVWR